MKIERIGSRPSAQGPEDWFTGTVRVDPLFDAKEPARAAGARVTFEPGASEARDYSTCSMASPDAPPGADSTATPSP